MRERNGGGYRELEQEIIEQNIERFLAEQSSEIRSGQPVIGEAIPVIKDRSVAMQDGDPEIIKK